MSFYFEEISLLSPLPNSSNSFPFNLEFYTDGQQFGPDYISAVLLLFTMTAMAMSLVSSTICIHVHNCSKHRQLPNYIRNLILYQMATLMGKSSA